MKKNFLNCVGRSSQESGMRTGLSPSISRQSRGVVGRSTTRTRLSTLLLLSCAGFSFAQPSYQNPVIPGDNPDPSIIRVRKDFWATSTSSEWAPQFQLYHSSDLINWALTGVVFQHRPEWAAGNFW